GGAGGRRPRRGRRRCRERRGRGRRRVGRRSRGRRRGGAAVTGAAAPRPDVVVVGGGAIGLASAWRLAQRGLAVTIVDPAPGGGASAVAAGMLAPVTEARP